MTAWLKESLAILCLSRRIGQDDSRTLAATAKSKDLEHEAMRARLALNDAHYAWAVIFEEALVVFTKRMASQLPDTPKRGCLCLDINYMYFYYSSKINVMMTVLNSVHADIPILLC